MPGNTMRLEDGPRGVFSRWFTLHKDDTSARTASGKRNRRIKNLIIFSGGATIVLASLWFVIYLVEGNMPLAAVNAVAAAFGLILIALALRNHLQAASVIMVHAFTMAIFLSSLADVPTDGIPRSAHLNFLPLTATAFLLFSQAKLYMRRIFPLIPVLACIGFSLDVIPLPWPELATPPEGRALGLWFNSLTGIGGTAIVMAFMQSRMEARHRLESDMRRGLVQGEYFLHYQPQVNKSGALVGVEALLRWHHPTRGNVSPADFIPLAEETGMILPIGNWVLRKSCQQLVEWSRTAETEHLTIAVNVSAVQFQQPDFVQEVKTIIELTGANPARIKLELTESALAEDIDTISSKMHALKALGITLSLDDFGTGYSSLSALKRLPLDQLKIDQSFVRDIEKDARDEAFIETIVQLCGNLHLDIIAEGVETKEQLQKLDELGCTSYQGYFFSRPLTADDLSTFASAAKPKEKEPAASYATA